jgi:hypothetical protein
VQLQRDPGVAQLRVIAGGEEQHHTLRRPTAGMQAVPGVKMIVAVTFLARGR